MSTEWRVERDSMGEMKVPADALYGAQTARAVENFPISGIRFPRAFIQALGCIKEQAALVNVELKHLTPGLGNAIAAAAGEVAEGCWDSQFVVDIFQTGSGTSTNMNANEVIARLARQRCGDVVHPNDHVNLGQSSNDVIPTALHLAAWQQIQRELIPSLERLQRQLEKKADDFADVLKIGRTHLQDATPMFLGQEMGGYASQVRHGIERLQRLEAHLTELALGGTAVGTGINTDPAFAGKVIAGLNTRTGLHFREAENHFEAQSARDAVVEASGALKTVAVSLVKIANDLRFLASGPRLGYGELRLPATQPGSSIMPGKVNPVICEMVLQVSAQVIGNDAAIAFGGSFGNFELNAMIPVMAHNLLQSISLLARASDVFARRTIVGLEANREVCEGGVEQSLGMATPLAPVIGYERAAEIAKAAVATRRTVREVALEQSGLSPEVLERLLDARQQARPTDRT